MNAILTGSYAYGRPKEDSDIDLVVMMSQAELDRMLIADPSKELNYPPLSGHPMRFGKLNLIVCTDEKSFTVWRKGTAALKELAPVSRDTAVELFNKLRKEAGLVSVE